MSTTSRHDVWAVGVAYERYMGRWSRPVAARFLDWLATPAGAQWLDLGCGTGALTQSILARCEPRSVVGIDPSEGFVAHARATTPQRQARFEVGAAQTLPLADASVDVAASALVLNFVPDPVAALRELMRVVRPGGKLSFYVWDYPGAAWASSPRSGRRRPRSIRRHPRWTKGAASRSARRRG